MEKTTRVRKRKSTKFEDNIKEITGAKTLEDALSKIEPVYTSDLYGRREQCVCGTWCTVEITFAINYTKHDSAIKLGKDCLKKYIKKWKKKEIPRVNIEISNIINQGIKDIDLESYQYATMEQLKNYLGEDFINKKKILHKLNHIVQVCAKNGYTVPNQVSSMLSEYEKQKTLQEEKKHKQKILQKEIILSHRRPHTKDNKDCWKIAQLLNIEDEYATTMDKIDIEIYSKERTIKGWDYKYKVEVLNGVNSVIEDNLKYHGNNNHSDTLSIQKFN